ncbi:MAG: hypothetical protein AB9873_19275 [Syntrophobacteraceae bacterium]
MAGRALFRVLVDQAVHLGLVGRVDDLPDVIENPHFLDGLLLPDGVDGLVQPVGGVEQHVGAGGKLDGVAQEIDVSDHLLDELLPLVLDGEIRIAAREAEDQKAREHADFRPDPFVPRQPLEPHGRPVLRIT